MRTLGVGIIGFGFMGRTHSYGHLNIPLFYDPPPLRTKLVGVCTSRPETGRKALEVVPFEFATTDYRELLKRDDIHIIHCCTPNRVHFPLLMDAMKSGKHIYCDKPLAANVQEAREIAALSARGTAKYQMAHQCRFLPATLRAKQLVQDGFLGKVFHFRAEYLHAGYTDPNRPMSWRLSKEESGGGALFDLGSHIIDLVAHLLGDFESVFAIAETLIKERPVKGQPGVKQPVEVDDLTLMTVRMKSGAVGVIESSRLATGAQDECRFEIHGERGAMRFNIMDPNWLYVYDCRDAEGPYGGHRGFKQLECVQRYPAPSVLPAAKVSVGWLRGHLHCLYDFLIHIAHDTPTSPSLAEGARVHEVMDAAYRSARNGQWAMVNG